MQLNLVALTTVKAQLGISGSEHDTAITAMIPIVSADVRRILNNDYDKYIIATITSGSDQLTISSNYFPTYSYSQPPLPLGQVIYNSNLPDDTYLQSFNPDTSIYTMSGDATGDDDNINPTLNIAQWPAVSKMIWYRITGQSTSSVDDRTVASETYGPVSKTYADSEINKKYNYPQVLIDDLGVPFTRVG